MIIVIRIRTTTITFTIANISSTNIATTTATTNIISATTNAISN